MRELASAIPAVTGIISLKFGDNADVFFYGVLLPFTLILLMYAEYKDRK